MAGPAFSSLAELAAAGDPEETVLGPLTRLPGSAESWVVSPWFGFLDRRLWDPGKATYIHHLDLGWLLMPPQPGGDAGYHFHHPELGWFWTSPHHYPYLHLRSSDRWVMAPVGADQPH